MIMTAVDGNIDGGGGGGEQAACGCERYRQGSEHTRCREDGSGMIWIKT